MDLKTFLLARIAEDEAVAREVHEWEAKRYPELAAEFHSQMETYTNHYGDEMMVTTYPARVLAECAAKRAIVEGWEDPATVPGWYGERGEGAAENLDGVVRALAAVYADHPDYQPEWAA